MGWGQYHKRGRWTPRADRQAIPPEARTIAVPMREARRDRLIEEASEQVARDLGRERGSVTGTEREAARRGARYAIDAIERER